MRRLLFLFFVISTSRALTPTQKESMDNLAWLHAQFSLTFDKNELPLIEHFKTNREEFDKFKDVLDFFGDANLQRHFQGVDMNEFTTEFDNQCKIQQAVIVNQDLKPLPFKAFYILFDRLFKTQQTFYGPGVESYRSQWNTFVNNKQLMNQFCSDVNISTDEEIIEALKSFDISMPFSTYGAGAKKLKAVEKTYHKCDNFEEKLKGIEDWKPSDWTFHHIIPSSMLSKFYQAYFELLKFKSDKLQKKFNWIKIMEFNTQKTMLVESATVYKLIGSSKLPSDTVRPHISPEQEGEINNQIDFVRAWYRWPRGLLFYGPSTTLREDDPSKNPPSEPKYEGFEEKAVHIIGQHYFEKVKELHVQLKEFNDKYEKQRVTDEGKESMGPEAQRLYIRLGTIYKEYNNEPIVAFPFNTHQWVVHDGKWKINTDFPTTDIVYDVVSNEWREKTLAQEADMEEQTNFDFVSTNLAVLGALSTMQKYHYDHDELKRRKRHHVHDPIVYVDELFETCERYKEGHKIKIESVEDPCNYYFENGSPSILAVPAWGWCKVFG